MRSSAERTSHLKRHASQRTRELVTLPSVSVIIPTLNEAGNVSVLVPAVESVLANVGLSAEILIADGGSTDGTREEARELETHGAVRLTDTASGRGLAGDVLVAAHHAVADVVVVMDADGSHDPHDLPRLIRPVLEGTRDVVLGSRYAPGGKTEGWPARRRFVSRVAALLAWPWVDVRDPTSGYFALRRDQLLAVDPNAYGFKIGLEVLMSADDGLRVAEVPITFRNRRAGSSKMGVAEVRAYLVRLSALAGGGVASISAARFGLVGLIGWVVDLTLFHIMWKSGLGLSAAHGSSFFFATALNYLLDRRWAVRDSARDRHRWRESIRFITVSLLALILRGGVLTVGHEQFGWPPMAALCVAISVAAVVNYVGCAYFVFPNRRIRSPAIRWRSAAVGLIGYTLLLRLVYLGLPDLIPQEAYYWNYSQHPALSYLDHPPMIAWLITLGTALFGDTELGVRVGAYLCWLVTAVFLFTFARNLYEKTTALKAVMLAAALPFYLVSGFVTTPDAPLVACWAGALCFLERALLAEKRLAWWGVGACLGLGMLSKYTIALLPLAILVFLLLDRRSRRWLTCPEPYAGALLTAALLTPVLVWNARHGWASFVFQGTRRLTETPELGVQTLTASILLLLTPVGAFAALVALVPARRSRLRQLRAHPEGARRRLFMTVLTLMPLAVFVLFSLRHEPKLNWSGPLWLVLLPAVAHRLPAGGGRRPRGFRALGARAWVAALTLTLLSFGGLLHYVTLGIPGVPQTARGSLPIAWEELGRNVEAIEDEVEAAAGPAAPEPLVVGMDKYFLASALAFYRRHGDEGIEHTASRHLFGGNALMYAYWLPAARQRGRALVLISLDRDRLAEDRLTPWVERLGPIRTRLIEKHGRPALRYYFRVAQSYRTQHSPLATRLASVDDMGCGRLTCS